MSSSTASQHPQSSHRAAQNSSRAALEQRAVPEKTQSSLTAPEQPQKSPRAAQSSLRAVPEQPQSSPRAQNCNGAVPGQYQSSPRAAPERPQNSSRAAPQQPDSRRTFPEQQSSARAAPEQPKRQGFPLSSPRADQQLQSSPIHAISFIQIHSFKDKHAAQTNTYTTKLIRHESTISFSFKLSCSR